jgi:chromosome partitioning protein
VNREILILGMLKQKGGAGATTLSVHLAVAAWTSGRRVLVLDVDPQRSAGSWGSTRGDAPPTVRSINVASLPAELAAAERDGYDLVIVDTPANSSSTALAVARAATLGLVPVRPSALDVAALPATVEIIRQAEVPALLVLNACPARAREVDEAHTFLLDRGALPVWGGTVGDRTVFRRAIAGGSAVTEVEPKGKAADEIRSLWLHVEHLLLRV